MASIQKRPDGRWRARYRDEADREHARHFTRKVDAQRWLDTVTASIVRGDYVDPKAGRETVRAYSSRWQSVQVSSSGTARIVDNALRRHIMPALGGRAIGAVRRSDVQAFIKLLETKGLSAGTVRNIYEVAARVFDAAVDDRVISASPCRRITFPKSDGDEVVPPTVEEVAALRSALDPQWQAVVVTLAGSGLRVGELLGLSVSDVDFLRGTIRVERQRLQSGELAAVKSRTSRRIVPVGQVVIEALAAYLAAYPSDDALFRDEWGVPLSYRRWKRLLGDAACEAGVRVTSHGLRHFAASALISGGASVKQVQTFLGHSSAVITLRTYAHLFPGDEDRTRNVLDAALGPLADFLRTTPASEG
ncbi:site-specific integrase [Nocardioides sp.]|jgi:integrase|uniref:tyrosine-type recombinase/integrase n=1 Tax=Nocardioides sp. TaxID=35761 RepID=UPI002F3FEFBE